MLKRSDALAWVDRSEIKNAKVDLEETKHEAKFETEKPRPKPRNQRIVDEEHEEEPAPAEPEEMSDEELKEEKHTQALVPRGARETAGGIEYEDMRDDVCSTDGAVLRTDNPCMALSCLS